MRNANNASNERIDKQSQSKNQNKISNRIKLPSINNKEQKLNFAQSKSIRNPQSANLSNKIINNVIEIGKNIYNRDIITPNLVNMCMGLEQENKDFISNNINNSKSHPKYMRKYCLRSNKQLEKNNFNIERNNKMNAFVNNRQNIIGTTGSNRKIKNNDLKILNNQIPINIKEQLCYLNDINNINRLLNKNQKNIGINYNKKIDNNLTNNQINYFSKINTNKSSNLLKKIEVSNLLKRKNGVSCNKINNNLNSIALKEISKESPYYSNKITNDKEKKSTKSNSKTDILEKKFNFINPINSKNKINQSNIAMNNNQNNKVINNINYSNNINNKEDLSFMSYSYNEYANIPFRKSMEDYHCIKKNLLKNNSIIFSYFSIFDGHSGNEVALFLSKNLHKIISSQLTNLKLNSPDININIERFNDNIISFVKKSFEIADEEIIKDLSYNNEVGSTGTIVLLYKIKNSQNINDYSRYVLCSNIGDSKGYILTRNNFIQITKEHKCNDIKEVERIKKMGGIVFSNRVFGTLMLTRSFGDKEMKKYGVISTPDCYCHKIRDEDLYIVIASDGIWDSVCEEELMQMGGEKLSSDDFSKNLVKLARDKGTRDNISCIVIKLNKDI